jgi:ABC-type Fe3+/spermidine/putrescine transport system ATPase subunit
MRLVMGLEHCDEGEVVYRGEVVDSATRGLCVPTHKRNMGMVFQSYAIWPHMTVYENVAYPLQVRGVKTAQIRDAVDRALDLVGLSGFGNRLSPNLSGGQQQRVALARSLVFEPELLLLDEPFSNLDTHLREQMRTEVRILQRRLGITILFVTHDQTEALGLSDRIVVMRGGRIEQIGTPRDLYERPGTPAVRDFLGRTITIPGRVLERDNDGLLLDVGNARLRADRASALSDIKDGDECTIAVRPEKIEIKPGTNQEADSGENWLAGKIDVLLFIGDRYEATIRLTSGASVLLLLASSSSWREGQNVLLHFPKDTVQIWPA